jgi:hypothetical protein
MSPAGFETAIPASERPQTFASDRATTGIGVANEYIFFESKGICTGSILYKI